MPLRLSWPKWFPPVYVHVPWRAPGGRGESLSTHAGFEAAKAGDEDAACQVVEELIKENCLEDISGCLCGKRTFIMSPAKTPDVSANALAYTLAKVISIELDLEVHTGVFQRHTTKRDKTSFWPRFANPVEFYGNVVPGADYILVDDVLTLGGTLAALRALIESQGGRVICMSALAGSEAGPVRIALDQSLQSRLRSKHGMPLDGMLKKELGYGIDELTHQEAGTLNGTASVDSIRDRIIRGRGS